MLTDDLIECILTTIPGKSVGLVGDLFLDRYLDIDASLTEPSIETGLDAYQVVGVRSLPGALGTVINNLAALGVGRILPFSFVGLDGEGYELRQALARLPGVDAKGLIALPGWFTPTYMKPMLAEAGKPPRELNRLDIKNRVRMPDDLTALLRDKLGTALTELDAMVVLDQVSEEDCGVVTASMRTYIADLGRSNPDSFILADSRERIGLFRNVHVKPNVAECLKATGRSAHEWRAAVAELAERCGRGVFCTRGGEGIALSPRPGEEIQTVGPYPVTGPIDVVGAGDSCTAGIVCATLAGAAPAEAAAFGNLIASITVQQIGTTGSASPEQVRRRWRAVRRPAHRS